MKASDRGIILGVAVVALAIAFYMLILAPKRDKASELSGQIDDLQASIAQQQQVAEFGEQARKDFPRYYGRLVVLGKAVPAQADTSSMLVQLNSITNHSKIRLNSISLAQGSGSSDSSSTTSTTTAPPSPTSATGTPSASASGTTGSTSSSSTATAAPVPATEASAATQPLGAIVGAAGLPTLPYELGMQGSFFDVADFMGGLDDLVKPQNGGAEVASNGRLFTVDGFSLSSLGAGGQLDASLLVNTYVTPEAQGLTAGASPSGPAPLTPGETETQPASAVAAK
jgi:Tfp pilus assembly protein PilO